MKKLLFFLSIMSVATAFTSCNNDGEIIDPSNANVQVTPETEVFFQGQKLLSNAETPAEARAFIAVMEQAGGLAWPKHTDEGWESARFSIRADGTIPDFYDKSSALYYGRPAGKSGVTSRNIGKVSTLFNYSRYDDRGFDYYKTDKATGNNIGLFRYIYDVEGKKTQPAILEAPSVVDILADEKEDLEAEVASLTAAGKSTTKTQNKLDDVNNLISKGADYLDSHVLWYVVKEVGGQYRWHINGVIRDEETPEYVFDPIPDNVEVDIHQQTHKDWNEIKASIHVRTDCSSVKVTIPLKEEDILEKDDFDIRVFTFYYKEYEVKHNITHDANGITIEITDIPADLIKELKENYGDGITIEVHSYCKKDVWEELQNSYVQTGKPVGEIRGQVTSALRPGEKKDIHVKKS
jgi:hypothetical protein